MTESTFRIVSHIEQGSYVREYPRSLVDSDSHTDGIRLAFKQYIPLDNATPGDGDVTIIAGHANGIPKECYEPLFVELWRRSKPSGFKIRSIWIADVGNQGASGVLNEDILGNDPCWTDHARDLLIFINAHRREMPQPLVALGHSGGASQLGDITALADSSSVQLSLMHPSLFKVLIFLECGWYPPNPGTIAAPSTLQRRDHWPSRDTAAETFQKSKFYQKWDPRCLDLFVRFGLRNGPSGVTLTTQKHQELATLLRPNDNLSADVADSSRREDKFHRPEMEQLFRRLPEVKPPVLYLFGEKSGLWSERKEDIVNSTGSGPGGSGGRKMHRVEKGIVAGGTHFMPLEKVEDCGEKSAHFLGEELRRWREEKEQLRKEWQDKPKEEHLTAHKTILEAFGEKAKTSNL